jgi:hypothetical protein
MSIYTHTAPERPTFTASLYSYFSLTPGDPNSTSWQIPFPAPLKACYSFTLSPDDPWAQLALQGSLVKLLKPGVIKATVPCFQRRDVVRLTSAQLDAMAESNRAEMIWVNERREVGVLTRVVTRRLTDGSEFTINLSHEIPLYARCREGTINYTLGFDFLALKTGFEIS